MKKASTLVDSKRVFWPSWEIWSGHALHLSHQQCQDVSLQVATQCGHVVWLYVVATLQWEHMITSLLSATITMRSWCILDGGYMV